MPYWPRNPQPQPRRRSPCGTLSASLRQLPAHPARLRRRTGLSRRTSRVHTLRRDEQHHVEDVQHVPGRGVRMTSQQNSRSIVEIHEASRILSSQSGPAPPPSSIQALHDFADVRRLRLGDLGAQPDGVWALAASTPVADHVKVDFELHRLPDQPAPALLELLTALLAGQAGPGSLRTASAVGFRAPPARSASSCAARPAWARSPPLQLRHDLPGLRPGLLPAPSSQWPTPTYRP